MDTSEEVSTTDLYEALKEELTYSQIALIHDVWLETLREMYKRAADKIPVTREQLPRNRQKYPKLTKAEATLLLQLFELTAVKEQQDAELWQKRQEEITTEL